MDVHGTLKSDTCSCVGDQMTADET